jgi:hypothetical protein
MKSNASVATALLISLGLVGCAAGPKSQGFLDGLTFRPYESDTADLRGKATLYVLLDPSCEMVREAAQNHGLLKDLDRSIVNDSTKIVLVGMVSRGQSFSAEDFRAWIKDNDIRTPYVFDSTRILARRHRIQRVPWALLTDSKGQLKYSSPAETMDEGGEYRIQKALIGMRMGLEINPGEPEGDGCALEIEK